MLGMNDEQKNLLIRQIVGAVLAPAFTTWGLVSATQQATFTNVMATLIGALLTLASMAYSQWKKRDAGMIESAATVANTTIVTKPEIANVALKSVTNVLATTQVSVVNK